MLNLNRVSIAIFLIAFSFRFSSTLRHRPDPDNVYEPTKVALSLANHGSFADPFLIPTGPTAHVAPAFPLILSIVYRMFGDGVAGETAKRFLSCFISSLQYALMPWLAGVFGLPRSVGLAAALFGAVLPLQRYAESASSWESPWVAVLLMFLAAMTSARRVHAWFRVIWYGAVWGLALLFAPTLASVYVGFFWLLRKHWRAIAISVLITMLCLAPWAYRNKRQLGSWIWLTDNLGLELSISNDAGSASRMDANLTAGYFDHFHPSRSEVEALKVRQLGEVEYNRRRFAQALHWIADHPIQFCKLTAARAFYFWFPGIYLALVTLLAFAGLFHTFRTEPKTAAILAAIWIAYPLIFYIVQFDRRYRHPIEWSILLMAAQGICAFIHLYSRPPAVRR